jgi:hypothetical protein
LERSKRFSGGARSLSSFLAQFYNPMRRYSTLGYVSSVQFEQAQKI